MDGEEGGESTGEEREVKEIQMIQAGALAIARGRSAARMERRGKASKEGRQRLW